MTRRKFLRVAGAAIAAANLPFGARLAGAAGAAENFGGPTPNSQFYITSYSDTPAVNASQWRLKIHGLVRNSTTLSFDQLRALPAVHETLTLECISNPPDGSAIGNAAWVGAPLKPILDRAGVKANAVYAVMRAADGYYTGVPVEELARPENFMPYLMNGAPLPPAHGYPVRIFIPGKYGMKQPKWITEIEFVDRPFVGYWEARGWSNEAWRKVNSGFFQPKPGGGLLNILSLNTAARAKSPVEIIGWALAGPSGIRGVEVSTDDGASWKPARLTLNRFRYEWTVWQYPFAAPPGEYLIRVRATDGNGVAQPPSDPQTGAGMSGQPRMRLEVVAG